LRNKREVLAVVLDLELGDVFTVDKDLAGEGVIETFEEPWDFVSK
jgi:hypothetical protein